MTMEKKDEAHLWIDLYRFSESMTLLRSFFNHFYDTKGDLPRNAPLPVGVAVDAVKFGHDVSRRVAAHLLIVATPGLPHFCDTEFFPVGESW